MALGHGLCALLTLLATTRAYVVHIGSSNEGRKQVNTHVQGLQCPKFVGKSNWIGGDQYPDLFMVRVIGTTVRAVRIDTSAGDGCPQSPLMGAKESTQQGHACGPEHDVFCDRGRCCSVNGYCGTGGAYCNNRNVGWSDYGNGKGCSKGWGMNLRFSCTQSVNNQQQNTPRPTPRPTPRATRRVTQRATQPKPLPTCTCDHPGAGILNLAGYRCSDGSAGRCSDFQKQFECYATSPFLKAAAGNAGCRKFKRSNGNKGVWKDRYKPPYMRDCNIQCCTSCACPCTKGKNQYKVRCRRTMEVCLQDPRMAVGSLNADQKQLPEQINAKTYNIADTMGMASSEDAATAKLYSDYYGKTTANTGSTAAKNTGIANANQNATTKNSAPAAAVASAGNHNKAVGAIVTILAAIFLIM